ncbi:MAG: hypothetical protein QM820_26900 [Minicystis sp.]
MEIADEHDGTGIVHHGAEREAVVAAAGRGVALVRDGDDLARDRRAQVHALAADDAIGLGEAEIDALLARHVRSEGDVAAIVDPGVLGEVELAPTRRGVARDDDGFDGAPRALAEDTHAEAEVILPGDVDALIRRDDAREDDVAAIVQRRAEERPVEHAAARSGRDEWHHHRRERAALRAGAIHAGVLPEEGCAGIEDEGERRFPRLVHAIAEHEPGAERAPARRRIAGARDQRGPVGSGAEEALSDEVARGVREVGAPEQLSPGVDGLWLEIVDERSAAGRGIAEGRNPLECVSGGLHGRRRAPRRIGRVAAGAAATSEHERQGQQWT